MPAFTLIEVLVVVAIIALLAAILIPSLQRAREQGKIASCRADSKQIGTLTATYQAEYKGYVPVLFNYPTRQYCYDYGPYVDPASGAQWYAPARTSYLSVALRAYDKGTAKLAQKKDPSGIKPHDADYYGTEHADKIWSPSIHRNYEDRILPKHYICPFARDDGDGYVTIGEMTLKGPSGTMKFNIIEWQGKHESYNSWKWEGLLLKGKPPIYNGGDYEIHPFDPNQGRAKYSILSWNNVYHPRNTPDQVPSVSSSFVSRDALKSINLHRRWSTKDTRRLKCASLSDLTILYCAEGMYMGRLSGHTGGSQMYNTESHRTSTGAGTIALFADTHVEWVKGTSIGWQ
jgi:prepilin-type N-terminal cleavage/methylation domain-containing protein